MPFYRPNEDDLRPDDDSDPEDVPRAIAAVGFDMFTKGVEIPVHAHRKAQLIKLGYESAGAFLTMFRKALGKPPARYLAERRIAA